MNVNVWELMNDVYHVRVVHENLLESSFVEEMNEFSRWISINFHSTKRKANDVFFLSPPIAFIYLS